MKVNVIPLVLVSLLIIFLSDCKKEEENPSQDCTNNSFFSEYNSRNFDMGFSTWAYAATVESVDATYQFISNNADVYSEHIDFNIPWDAWINGSPLPQEFTNEIAARKSRKIANAKLDGVCELIEQCKKRTRV